MSDYQFTNDWFERVSGHWPDTIAKLKRCKTVLEIGSYEGASACWLIENAIEDGGSITCVDTWRGGEEHAEHNMYAVQARFKANMEYAAKKRYGLVRWSALRMESARALADHKIMWETFDLVYIDGSHQAPDVLTDAVMSWPLVNVGGIVIFDDYEWQGHEQATHRPKMAINAFLSVFADELEVVHRGYQIAVRRVR